MMSVFSFLRSLVLLPLIVFHTFWCSIVVVSLLLLRAPRAWVDFFIGPVWCGGIVRLCGIKVVVTGKENVPLERGFLYLFTHSSLLDIPVMFEATPKSFRFGAKSSLFKIPVFSQAMTLSGTLPITRDNREKVMEVYKEAETRVAKGEAFALAPEGGRRVGDEIKDFKSGPFIFAINAKMPIVPVVLSGVGQVLPKKTLLINKDRWTREVGVSFLPAIETQNIPIEEMKSLKSKVRDQIVSEFERLNQIYNR